MNEIKVNAGKNLTFWICKITGRGILGEGIWYIGALGVGREHCHCVGVMEENCGAKQPQKGGLDEWDASQLSLI